MRLGICRSVVLVVETGEESSKTLHGNLKLGVEVDERSQLVGQPLERHLFFAAPMGEFLDASIREIHVGSLSSRPSRCRPARWRHVRGRRERRRL